MDTTNPRHREQLTQIVLDALKSVYGNEWKRRCGAAAGLALRELQSQGIMNYRVAAGRVVETDQAAAKTGHEPWVRYEGEYSGTGSSQYHVWLVDDATGHKIDYSELPSERYGRPFLWEPYEMVPELEYAERPEITMTILPTMMRQYGPNT